jgi:hypothetical protein
MKAFLLFAGLLLTSLSCRSQSTWADESESIRMFKRHLTSTFSEYIEKTYPTSKTEKDGLTYLLLKGANGKVISLETGMSTPPELDSFLRAATKTFTSRHLLVMADLCDTTVLIPIRYSKHYESLYDGARLVLDDYEYRNLAQEVSLPLLLIWPAIFNDCFSGLKLDYVPRDGLKQGIAPCLINRVITGQYP